jgi:hypothetical protein
MDTKPTGTAILGGLTSEKSDKMKNAIITYLDMNFSVNFIYDFIPTLFADGNFKGELHVISYGLREREKKIIAGSSDRIKIHEAVKARPVHIQRWFDVLPILKSIDSDVVMTIDAGDVWFQGDFREVFEMCNYKIGLIQENSLCNGGWTLKTLDDTTNDNFKNRFIKITNGKNLMGSGMICGNRDLMIRLFSSVCREIETIPENHLGVDQLALDMVAYGELNDRLIMVPHTYGFVTLKVLNKYEISDGKKIIDSQTGEPVKIVHNAGGKFRTWANGRRGF